MTDSLDRLYQQVLSAKDADPAVSRTARLLRAGRGKVAKKMAEEAVEVVIDAMNGDREAVVRESADLLYNLVGALGRVRPSPGGRLERDEAARRPDGHRREDAEEPRRLAPAARSCCSNSRRSRKRR